MTFSISVSENSGVGEARRLATRLAAELKFSEADMAKVGIIVTEAANNLVKHTPKGGEVILQAVHQDNGNSACLEVLACDKGPGINNLAQCFVDGYSTAGTMGTGLGAIKRLATAFEVYSLPNLGTTLWIQITPGSNRAVIADHISSTTQRHFDISGICIPVKGENVCGDGWFTYLDPTNSQLWCLVVDGLGHGDGAHLASELAIGTFKSCRDSASSLSEIVQTTHTALKKTRGVAMAIARIDIKNEQLDYVGIGNTSGVIVGKKKRQSMMSLNGIVGNNVRKLQEVSYPFLPDSLLIMHSDGLKTHWDTDHYPHLLQKPAALVAGVLYHDHKRGSDDVTIMVVKNKT